jgi:hypothetical protein
MSEQRKFGTIDEIFDDVQAFSFPVGGENPQIHLVRPGLWRVLLNGEEIGTIEREIRDRATYYVSRTADEPHEVSWVSDELRTHISRLLLLA